MPSVEAAPGPIAAKCPECGVVVRFMRGFEPKPVPWSGSKCPACRREEIRIMSNEEQREVLLDMLRADPTTTADTLFHLTGSRISRKVRREAVKMGIAVPLHRNGHAARAAKPAPRPKKNRRTLQVEAGAERVREAVETSPGDGAGEVADRVGMTRTTARRHLKALMQAGEVRTAKEGRNVRYFPAGSKSG